MRSTLIFLAFVIGVDSPAFVLAQDQTGDVEEEQSQHNPDDPFLDIKLAQDNFVSELWAVGLNYDCNKSRRRAQESNFNQKFGKRISAAFEKVRAFGPDVANHSHDILAIGRCWKPPRGGGSLPANARPFEASLKSFENFLAQRKAN